MALLAAVTKRGRNGFVYCSARYLWKQNSIIQNSPAKYYLNFFVNMFRLVALKNGKNIPCKFFMFYFYFLISGLENNINVTINYKQHFFLSLW